MWIKASHFAGQWKTIRQLSKSIGLGELDQSRVRAAANSAAKADLIEKRHRNGVIQYRWKS
jgi:hypothetical protein